eukprot:6021-Heterococcus_DN1.PRE.1
MLCETAALTIKFTALLKYEACCSADRQYFENQVAASSLFLDTMTSYHCCSAAQSTAMTALACAINL